MWRPNRNAGTGCRGLSPASLPSLAPVGQIIGSPARARTLIAAAIWLSFLPGFSAAGLAFSALALAVGFGAFFVVVYLVAIGLSFRIGFCVAGRDRRGLHVHQRRPQGVLQRLRPPHGR